MRFLGQDKIFVLDTISTPDLLMTIAFSSQAFGEKSILAMFESTLIMQFKITTPSTPTISLSRSNPILNIGIYDDWNNTKLNEDKPPVLPQVEPYITPNQYRICSHHNLKKPLLPNCHQHKHCTGINVTASSCSAALCSKKGHAALRDGNNE